MSGTRDTFKAKGAPTPAHVVIEVSGGLVTNVFSSDPDATVEIYDWDNIHDADDDSPDEREAEFDAEVANMTKVY